MVKKIRKEMCCAKLRNEACQGEFVMSEKAEIIFMQTRLIRLASEEWHLSVEQIISLFKKADVLGYIEKGYGIFHCEGDEAVLEDIAELFDRKGIKISA